MREWLTRVRDWLRRDKLDGELAEELRFHRERLERDAVADGDDSTHAVATSHRRLGNDTRIREETRGYWSLPWIDHLRQDLRYALRGLRRTRGFTATVVLTLALGIGANAAMFGVVDRLMFRPFPFLRDPGSVNRVYVQTTSNGKVNTYTDGPYVRYLDMQRETSRFSEFAGVAEWTLALGSGMASREHRVAGVSATFFRFFDARPVVGRYFGEPEDQVPRGADVVVLSEDYWRSELGGRNVLGETLRVGPLLLTIIGVAPSGFVGVTTGEPPAVFLPITTLAYGMNQGGAENFATQYSWTWMSIIARRKAGVSADAATADLSRAYVLSRNNQRLLNPRTLPDSIAHPRAIAGPLKTAAGPGAGLEARTLLWVSGVALVVLLIACANVANLLFARMLQRQREIAVRLALGASRRRLVAQFLTESLLLSGLGCIAGVVMAQWVSVALERLIVKGSATSTTAVDWRTVGAASACALVVGVATGIGPAILSLRGDLTATLRADARAGGSGRSGLRSTLLVMQAALSVVLLVGAGIFVRSLDHVRHLHLGWEPERVLIATPNYRGFKFDSTDGDAFRRRLLETAQSLPDVEHAARMNSLPFATNTFDLHVPGIDSVGQFGRFNYQATTPDYFATLGTRIVEGRGFNAADRAGSALVSVVSQSMARALWPGQSALGKCIQVEGTNSPCRAVVGVAEDVVQQSMSDDQRLMYYLLDEQPPFHPVNRIFLRIASGTPREHAEAIRVALQRMMPGESYVNVGPLEDLVDTQRRSWTLGATMFASFGALALCVAGIGLYSAIAFSVTQRMHELGVRIALGAPASNIVRLVVSQSMSLAAIGVATGLAIAYLAAPWVEPLLFMESPRDPLVYGIVAAVMAATALVASLPPTLRAVRSDPNQALRAD